MLVRSARRNGRNHYTDTDYKQENRASRLRTMQHQQRAREAQAQYNKTTTELNEFDN